MMNLADYYLVLTGPDGAVESSKGKTRPLVISQVFLFKTGNLIPELKERGVKIGIATSVRKQSWESARIYPVQRNSELVLHEKQIILLSLFHTSQDSVSVEGNIFSMVCDIKPVRDEDGTIYVDRPYLRYNNIKGLKREPELFLLVLNPPWLPQGSSLLIGSSPALSLRPPS